MIVCYEDTVFLTINAKNYENIFGYIIYNNNYKVIQS